jgi:hypothetical protein
MHTVPLAYYAMILYLTGIHYKCILQVQTTNTKPQVPTTHLVLQLLCRHVADRPRVQAGGICQHRAGEVAPPVQDLRVGKQSTAEHIRGASQHRAVQRLGRHDWTPKAKRSSAVTASQSRLAACRLSPGVSYRGAVMLAA